MKFKLSFVSLSIFLFLNFLSLNAQSVTGQILDSKTKEAISFATIQFGENDGVVSNAEGYFTLNIEKLDASKSFTVSYMGYQTETLTVDQLVANKNIVSLVEAINQLDTVYITNKFPSIDSIMKMVNRNLSKNHNTALSKHSIFTRETAFFKPSKVDIEIEKSSGFKKSQLEASNKQLDSLSRRLTHNQPSQTFTDVLSDFYLNDNSQSKMEVVKATKLFDVKNQNNFDEVQKKATNIVLKHLDVNKTYKLKSGLFKIEDSLSLKSSEKKKDSANNNLLTNLKAETYDFFMKNQFGATSFLDFVLDTSIYDYTIEDVTNYQGDFVYIIKFMPKKRKANYIGKLYISETDYAVLKVDYAFAEGKTGEKLNLKFLLGVKYVENEHKGSIIFRKSTDTSVYYPYYINQELQKYVYVHRPIKFIENGGDKNKVGFDFVIEGHVVEKMEYLNLGHTTVTSSDFNAIKEAKNVDYQKLNKYDASIWKGYNAIEPLEEMKQFKVEE